MTEPLSIGMCAQLACILEATARKPGNVSRYADFEDLTYLDCLLSAAAISPVMEEAPGRPIGATVLEAIRATRRMVSTNTNLGIVLVLAPLCSVPREMDLRGGLMSALLRVSVDDARAVYDAIRLAKPGGLGEVPEQDVAGEPTRSLREVMGLAADRDLIARQYVNDFEQVFEGVQLLTRELESNPYSIESAIVTCFLELLAKYPDSLIARKSGKAAADAVSQYSRAYLERKPAWRRPTHRAGTPFDRLIWDSPLTRDRNPGTTADLVTGSLFVALRRGIIEMPLSLPFASDRPPTK